MCGGTPISPPSGVAPRGLSPRVRGNRAGSGLHRKANGSIPACAGEPGGKSARQARDWVYPRVCGGTRLSLTTPQRQHGLSPRVRGNPGATMGFSWWTRSIPACAGEPSICLPGRSALSVYPRVCGGTSVQIDGRVGNVGLSPRVRGNLMAAHSLGLTAGSIPACAGEPRRRTSHGYRPSVYPRVCGGTKASLTSVASTRGLSPRVRGNRSNELGGGTQDGSIPACAGEPPRPGRTSCAAAVYPRVCGGTCHSAPLRRYGGGLSPRVRGNLLWQWPPSPPNGSIPACAGEPARGRLARRTVGVYPRVCGGTFELTNDYNAADGLSPRVRGNLGSVFHSHHRPRSIPACAGEPPGRRG